MIGFERDGTYLVAHLDEVEVSLLSSLVGQVNDLLGAGVGAPEVDDAFAWWESSFHTAAPLDANDPVVARLFPDAYADDAVAAAEHRRFTQDEQRQARVRDAAIVLADLERAAGGRARLEIDREHAEAWLKTLNGVRLALAVRLGIEAEADHEALERLSVRDPRSQVVALYDWLAIILEGLLDAMSR
ncbi:MAG: DUF2017 family protein [Propioniciclava sp.]